MEFSNVFDVYLEAARHFADGRLGDSDGDAEALSETETAEAEGDGEDCEGLVALPNHCLLVFVEERGYEGEEVAAIIFFAR